MNIWEIFKEKFRKIRWKHFHIPIKAILMILIPISIVLGAGHYLLYDEAHYQKEFTKVGTYERVPDADDVIESMLLFFKGEEDDPGPANFTSDETMHLRETKSLIWSMTLTWYILISVKIILFGILIFTSKKAIEDVIHIAVGSGTLMLAWPIMLSEIDFNYLFTAFHDFFFPNGGWMFSESTLLIQLFPMEFFWDSAAKMAYGSFFLGAALLTFALVTWAVTRRK